MLNVAFYLHLCSGVSFFSPVKYFLVPNIKNRIWILRNEIVLQKANHIPKVTPLKRQTQKVVVVYNKIYIIHIFSKNNDV